MQEKSCFIVTEHLDQNFRWILPWGTSFWVLQGPTHEYFRFNIIKIFFFPYFTLSISLETPSLLTLSISSPLSPSPSTSPRPCIQYHLTSPPILSALRNKGVELQTNSDRILLVIEDPPLAIVFFVGR